jgi:hypothetical protein
MVILGFAAPDGRKMCAAAHGVITKDLTARRKIISGPCGLDDPRECYVHGRGLTGKSAPARGERPALVVDNDDIAAGWALADIRRLS